MVISSNCVCSKLAGPELERQRYFLELRIDSASTRWILIHLTIHRMRRKNCARKSLQAQQGEELWEEGERENTE